MSRAPTEVIEGIDMKTGEQVAMARRTFVERVAPVRGALAIGLVEESGNDAGEGLLERPDHLLSVRIDH